jgi:molybdopterin synthase catalytic subunit
MAVYLKATPFEYYRELEAYQQTEMDIAHKGKFGASAIFVGTMRDFNLGDTVSQMTLEYYPGMTERRLEGIAQTAHNRWELVDSLVIHRVGEILPNENIVLVAVWSAHRGEAFDACRYIIEELKHSAPFWKKETTPAGNRWVESNTPA